MWFTELTGVEEKSYKQVQDSFSLFGNLLASKANGKCWSVGDFNVTCLQHLLNDAKQSEGNGEIKVKNIVSDVQDLHRDPKNDTALFQVASQFNCLEMINEDYTPEDGLNLYSDDPTQGPACAISAGAATIYRNYFLNSESVKKGQTAEKQIDTLSAFHKKLCGIFGENLWEMKNGYLFITEENLKKVNSKINKFNNQKRDKVKGTIRYGFLMNADVTLYGSENKVSQFFCSALPVSYNKIRDKSLWQPFARLILEAAYEATLAAAVINSNPLNDNSNKVFLTCLGLGAFGNSEQWVVDAMQMALQKFKNYDLEVFIVHYRNAPRRFENLANNF